MEIGWSELLLIGVVALIVIGPKDLPEMFRTLGRFTAKLRSMAREFSRAMEDAAKESGVKDVAEDLKKMTSPKSLGLDAVKSAADKFEKWDPLKGARPGAAASAAAASGAAGATAAAAPPAATT
ncbi:Sec-independent protein translocase protein TatB, partial [Pseudogemmobacter sonorensis]|uniref:Sec-independent protein translocase protein TatB n=1 Tax=Pseudogemmobacter sonorensis TaxID=2989681 RepID=UPI0036A2D53C